MGYRQVEIQNMTGNVGRKNGILADSSGSSRVGGFHLCEQMDHVAKCRSSILIALMPKVVFCRVRVGYTRGIFLGFMSVPDSFVACVRLSYQYPTVLCVLCGFHSGT